VSGVTVHRLTASGFVGPYRVVDPGEHGTLEARGSATFGVARDENDNFTVACERCPGGVVAFSGANGPLSSGWVETLTARGDVVSERFSGNLFDALAAGAAAGNDGSTTADGNRLPAGQRTGSNDRRPGPPDDDDAKNTTPPTSTPTPTLTPGTVPTSTPTATATPLPILEATIASFVYLPEPIVVQVGQTIRWTNLDVPEHTVTADDHSFTSPLLGQNQTYTLTLTQPGTYTYFCEPHPFMMGEIEVR
jgi:plastocyanin